MLTVQLNLFFIYNNKTNYYYQLLLFILNTQYSKKQPFKL